MLWLVAAGFEPVAVANGDVATASRLIVASQIVKTALLLGAAVAFGTVQALVVAACIYGALHCVAFVVYIRVRLGNVWEAPDWPLLRAQLADALPFGAGGFAYTALLNLDAYYVAYHFDPAAFAIYSIGCFQLPFLSLLAEATGSVLIPEAARRERLRDPAGIAEAWADAVRKLALAYAPVCAFLFVMREEFITALFTPAYAASAPVFAVYLVVVFQSVAATSYVLRAFPALRFFRLKLCLALLPLAWAALVVGVRVGGLVGAVAAAAFVRLVDTAVTVAVLRAKLGPGRVRIRAFAPVLAAAAAAGAAALALLPLRLLVVDMPPLAALAVCAPAFAAVYAAAAYGSGAITVSEKAVLRALVGRT
jgi:O-antigen/teichoic acid export membrane protein